MLQFDYKWFKMMQLVSMYVIMVVEKKRSVIMTDKELQKLKRSELLEIMLGLQNELDDQREENKILQAKLDERTISIENAGSIAEAALEINGVLNDAQKAADVYLENVRKMHNEQESRHNEIIKNATDEAEKLYAAAKIEAEKIQSTTNAECQQKIREADELCTRKISETEKMCSEKISEVERSCSEKIKQTDEECSRRINETNAVCTKKIKETQEKCTALSSLDNKIATFFNNDSSSEANDIKNESSK